MSFTYCNRSSFTSIALMLITSINNSSNLSSTFQTSSLSVLTVFTDLILLHIYNRNADIAVSSFVLLLILLLSYFLVSCLMFVIPLHCFLTLFLTTATFAVISNCLSCWPANSAGLQICVVFCSVRSFSRSSLSFNRSSTIPATMRSLIKQSFNSPKLQSPLTLFSSVIYASNVSPACWFRVKN